MDLTVRQNRRIRSVPGTGTGTGGPGQCSARRRRITSNPKSRGGQACSTSSSRAALSDYCCLTVNARIGDASEEIVRNNGEEVNVDVPAQLDKDYTMARSE